MLGFSYIQDDSDIIVLNDSDGRVVFLAADELSFQSTKEFSIDNLGLHLGE